jgi:hypothetical protein
MQEWFHTRTQMQRDIDRKDRVDQVLDEYAGIAPMDR